VLEQFSADRQEASIPSIPPPKRHPYDQWSPDARALDIVGDKWTLLIVRDLAAGPRRFVEIQRVLPGISTEQLRSRLNRMVADGLLTRQRYREVPPRVDYELTDRSKDLLPTLGALGRWGFRWAWGEPRPGEREDNEDGEAIDIGAILRLTPGFLTPSETMEGTIEMVVHRDGLDAKHYLIALEDERATIEEHPAPDADVHVTGSQEAWIEAFGPRRSLRGLTITGDRALAERVLDEFSVAPAEIEIEATV